MPASSYADTGRTTTSILTDAFVLYIPSKWKWYSILSLYIFNSYVTKMLIFNITVNS